MLATLGRFLRGPPFPIVGGLIALQVVAIHVPAMLFGILLAGVAAAFMVLARPPRDATVILAASGMAYAALGEYYLGDPMAALIPLLFLGAPALLAAFLRWTDSLSLAILGGFLGAWAGAHAMDLLPLDLDQAWRETLETLRGERPEPFRGLPTELLIQIGNELMMASLALLSSLLLLLARRWQSALVETPFFAREFRALHHGRAASAMFLAVLAMSWAFPTPFMLGLSLCLTAAFLFPGVAAAHRLADRIRYRPAALIPFYVVLLSVQEALLAVAVAGAAGDLLGWRERTANDKDLS